MLEQYPWLTDAFMAVASPQAIIIALVLALLIPRYGFVVFAAIGAVIVNTFVTIAYHQIFNKSVEKVLSKVWEEILDQKAPVLIMQFLGFMLIITAFYFAKKLIFRGK